MLFNFRISVHLIALIYIKTQLRNTQFTSSDDHISGSENTELFYGWILSLAMEFHHIEGGTELSHRCTVHSLFMYQGTWDKQT